MGRIIYICIVRLYSIPNRNGCLSYLTRTKIRTNRMIIVGQNRYLIRGGNFKKSELSRRIIQRKGALAWLCRGGVRDFPVSGLALADSSS